MLNIDEAPVTIKTIERSIVDRAFAAGALRAGAGAAPARGKRVAVVGSGPAGLAAAQQLARGGHDVDVFERDDRIGGLLRYGIPDFKMEKELLDRRLEQMRAEGVTLRDRRARAASTSPATSCARSFDAVVLCRRRAQPRDLAVPGRELDGVHFAMDFLTQQNRRVAGDCRRRRRGDPRHRQARRRHRRRRHRLRLRRHVASPGRRERDAARADAEAARRSARERNPWPQWPLVFRTSSSQEEGGERDFAVMTKRLVGDERARASRSKRCASSSRGGKLGRASRAASSTSRATSCSSRWASSARSARASSSSSASRSTRAATSPTRDGRTSVDGVFAAGDMARGQSLVVWAIAEGRKVAATVDDWLSQPAPL